ncbi:MAG TPA: hypothetical protein VMU03_02740 [Gammaproteobacteria bacterium]|nr:hypothetical protein [Gammaproteobacteria bacterium]
MRHVLRLSLVALQLILAVALAERAASAADEDKFLGTWALNAAKSSAPAGGVPSSATVVLSKTGEAGTYKSVSDFNLAGTALHSEITFTIDGKDYTPVSTPAPPPGTPSVTQSFERVGSSAYKASVKVNGTTVATILNEVSADGKTLTSTTTGAGAAAGVMATLVFDRK